jgi:hypothetical protein
MSISAAQGPDAAMRPTCFGPALPADRSEFASSSIAGGFAASKSSRAFLRTQPLDFVS